ncbi:iron-sulfur cluster biosynthesis family protein [Lactobacillaceae bacterium L1_55_11]|nr:iron-sulfur cluster biosynthesis family protein [Lactobacillaceae bacterium L1_55_11]
MEITFTPAAKERLEKYLGDDVTMVLDFDDGVGPFSHEANCTLSVSFNLLFVDKDADLHDFQLVIPSNLGEVHAKKYSEDQMQPEMTIDVKEKYLRYTLSGNGGMIDDSLGVKNLVTAK